MPVFRSCPWHVMLLGGVVAAAAAAQTAAPGDADEARPPVPGQVLSDVQPLPAEDRDSTGALVLDQARVRAQQQTTPPPVRSGIKPIVGRDISRLVERTHDWSDVRDAQSTVNPPGEASGAPADPGSGPDAAPDPAQPREAQP